MGAKPQDTVFAVPAMHADNLQEFDLEEYPELDDDIIRGRIYLICELRFATQSVGADGESYERIHDCQCVLIKEFYTARVP